MVVCIHSVVGKKKFLVQFEDGQKKDKRSSSLVFLSLKEEVEMEEPISHLPEKEQAELLTINGDPEVGKPCIFVNGIYLYVFIICVMLRIYLQICQRIRWRKREIRT